MYILFAQGGNIAAVTHKDYMKKKVSASNQLRYLIFLTFLMLLPVVSWAACTGSSPNLVADSGSVADINACISAATAGDIITVPAGSSTWNSAISDITKRITIKGSGTAAAGCTNCTKITRGSTTASLIHIRPSSDLAARVSNIWFDDGPNNAGERRVITVTGSYSTTGVTQVRIDHNYFKGGEMVVWWAGWAYGLVDNNTFYNASQAIMFVGDNNAAWSREIAAGTTNAVFIENNNFVVDNNTAKNPPGEQIYHQEGARSVTRYNTFDGESFSGDFTPFESHGNIYYYGDSRVIRGQPIIEIYGNIFKAYKTYRFIYLRGGSSLVYNNTMTTTTGSPSVIALCEEEGYSGFFNPLKTEWPAEDQVTNSFFWNNILNGQSVTSVSLWCPNDSIFFIKDRDYFMHAPEASGGKATYTGRLGGAMTFSASGANAYYPYIPYTYPHPLRGIATGAIGTGVSIPGGVTIK